LLWKSTPNKFHRWLLVTAGVGDALLTLRVLALYKDKNKSMLQFISLQRLHSLDQLACITLRAAYGSKSIAHVHDLGLMHFQRCILWVPLVRMTLPADSGGQIEFIALCYYISSVRNPFQQTYPQNLGCVMTTLTEDPTLTSPEMDEIVQAIVAYVCRRCIHIHDSSLSHLSPVPRSSS